MRLTHTLLAAACGLALTAGAAAAQEPTRVTIDLSTAGPQPGAPPVTRRVSTQPTYVPTAPQRADDREAATPWDSPAAYRIDGAEPAPDDRLVLRVTTPFAANPLTAGIPLFTTSIIDYVVHTAAADHGDVTTPLTVVGEAQPALGYVTAGQAIVSAPVVHQLQARLTAPLDRFAGPFSGIKNLPVGTEFYGVQVRIHGPDQGAYRQAGDGQMVVWCAPRPGRSKSVWDGDCFVPVKGVSALNVGYRHWRLGADLFGPKFEDGDGLTRRLEVEQHPVGDAAPMRGSLHFVAWTDKAAQVSFALEAGGKATVMAKGEIARQPDGSALVKAFGGTFRLKPAGRDALVEVVRTPVEITSPMMAQAGAAPFAPG